MPRKKPTPDSAITPLMIESRIYVIRGVRLYEVETKVLNQSVDRNPDRFPNDFSFLITGHEFTNLRSQIVTSSSGYGGRRYRPRVFTEHGIAMLSSVLRSDAAVRVNIEIVLAFIRMRQLFATPGELVSQLQKLSETVQLHDTQIKAIIDVLHKMATPPMDPEPEEHP